MSVLETQWKLMRRTPTDLQHHLQHFLPSEHDDAVHRFRDSFQSTDCFGRVERPDLGRSEPRGEWANEYIGPRSPGCLGFGIISTLAGAEGKIGKYTYFYPASWMG